MEKNDEKKIGRIYFCAVAFAVVIGFSFLGIKACIAVADPLQTLVFRFNFALLAALVWIAIKHIKIRKPAGHSMKLLLTAGFYVAFMAFQTVGLLFATSIESGIIFAFIPIITIIIARIFLKEKTLWKQNLFAAVSATGVAGMFLFQGEASLALNVAGLLLLFLASLCMSLSNVMMRYVRAEVSPMEIACSIVALGCIFFNLVFVVVGLKNGTLGSYFEPLSSWSFVVGTLYLGIPATLCSSMLAGYMYANLPAIKATIFSNLSTAIAILAGALILKEPLFGYQIVCTVLIVAGVIGTSAVGGRPQTAQKALGQDEIESENEHKTGEGHV